MILEIASSIVLGSIAGYAKLKQTGAGNDADKIQKIFTHTGLNVKHGKETHTAQLIRKKKFDWGMQYTYRTPLGKAFSDYEAKKEHLEAGLNTKGSKIDVKLLKLIDFKQNPIPQLQSLMKNKERLNKEIEMFYDGFLHIKVYNKPLPKLVHYQDMPSSKAWCIPVGVTRENNENVQHDFEQIPHLVVGGATRYGKSNFLNMVIATLLKNNPDDVSFTLIDLKGGVEFGDYEDVRQVRHTAFEPEEALEAMEQVVAEMKQMQQNLRSKKVKNVQQAGIKKRHFIIIDEVGELNPDEAITKEDKKLKEAVQTGMSYIARIGAGLGYRLITSTQYPTGDVIPRTVKQNSDAKIAFRVQNGTASNVILGSAGAEQLPMIKGRCIYQTADHRKIIQTPFIEPKEYQQAIEPYIIEKKKKEVKKDVEQEGNNIVKFEETRLS